MNEPVQNASHLKRIAFEAVEVQFEEFQDGVQVFSAVAPLTGDELSAHVVMMRSHSDPATSLHVDCDYPLYGGAYDAVARAEVSSAGLRLDMRRDMEVQLRVLGGYDITWQLPGEQYEKIVQGLRSLFRGTHLLIVVGDGASATEECRRVVGGLAK